MLKPTLYPIVLDGDDILLLKQLKIQPKSGLLCGTDALFNRKFFSFEFLVCNFFFNFAFGFFLGLNLDKTQPHKFENIRCNLTNKYYHKKELKKTLVANGKEFCFFFTSREKGGIFFLGYFDYFFSAFSDEQGKSQRKIQENSFSAIFCAKNLILHYFFGTSKKISENKSVPGILFDDT